MREKKTAVALFAAAITYGLNVTGISPILGMLNIKYAHIDTSIIQLMQTLPFLCIMVGALGSGWLTTKVKKKTILFWGLILIGICGVLPFFVDGFWPLFVVRVIIGLGFGIMAPMNNAICAEVYVPEKRAGIMGLFVVGMGVGAIFGNLVGGILASFGEHFFYLIYLVPFVSAIMISIFLEASPVSENISRSTTKLNKAVWLISIAGFAHTLFINAHNTNISIYIAQEITEDTSVTGIVTAVNAVCALLVGVLFSKLFKLFRDYIVVVSVASSAIGYICILLIPGLTGAFIASALAGVSTACFGAGSAILISMAVHKDATAKGSGLCTTLSGIGGLIAPVFLGKIVTWIFGENVPKNMFIIGLVGMLIVTAATVFVLSRKKEK